MGASLWSHRLRVGLIAGVTVVYSVKPPRAEGRDDWPEEYEPTASQREEFGEDVDLIIPRAHLDEFVASYSDLERHGDVHIVVDYSNWSVDVPDELPEDISTLSDDQLTAITRRGGELASRRVTIERGAYLDRVFDDTLHYSHLSNRVKWVYRFEVQESGNRRELCYDLNGTVASGNLSPVTPSPCPPATTARSHGKACPVVCGGSCIGGLCRSLGCSLSEWTAHRGAVRHLYQDWGLRSVGRTAAESIHSRRFQGRHR